jgi:hypothetical protein
MHITNTVGPSLSKVNNTVGASITDTHFLGLFMYMFRIDLLPMVTIMVGVDLDAELSLNKSAVQNRHLVVSAILTPPFFHQHSCHIVYR